MRVTYVSPGIAPVFGGIGKDVPGLCREIARRGIEVSLLTTDVGSHRTTIERQAWTHRDGYKARYFRHLPLPGRLSCLALVTPGCNRVMNAAIRCSDVVHIYSLYNYLSSWAARYARSAGVPYVVEPHGTLDTFLYGHRRYRKRLFEFLWEKRNLREAAAVRCLSAAEAAQATRNLNMRIETVVIPTGIDLSEIPASHDCDYVYDAYGISRSAKKIVFVGRLHEKKGVDLLAQAFVRLAAEDQATQLVIIGPDDGMEASVRKLLDAGGALRRTVFTGMVVGEAKTGLMAAADVIVVPSYTENFGNVVIEAMALSRPLVVSSGVGIAEQVEEAKAGLVAKPVVGDLAEAIRAVLRNEGAAARMGRAGRALVEREFLWTSVGERVEALYRRIASTRRASPGMLANGR